jgi:hypothetical protein
MGYCIKLITVEITCRMPCPANVGQAKMDVDEREKDILGLTQGEPLNEPPRGSSLWVFTCLMDKG